MRKPVLVALMIGLIAAAGRADLFGCSETAARRVAAPLNGVSNVLVIGRAGTLRVTGRSGLREVVAIGTACADDRKSLDEIQLRSERQGSQLRIEAVIPDQIHHFFGGNGGKLDFEVTLPDNIALEVHDGSGTTTIENVGELKVDDGSGGLNIRGVHGNADITDGSGEIEIADVSGNLRVHDGSGGMDIERVGGNVVIDDGSGSIDIRGVQRNVTIEDDGSGSIDVRDVRGDFTVQSKGSGSITSDHIGGRVSLPRRR